MKRIILLLLFGIGSLLAQRAIDDSIRYVKYHIVAERLNFDVVDSYPQRIVQYVSKERPYEIIIQTFSASQDQEQRTLIESTPFRYDQKMHVYPGELKKYLEPTSLIESDSPIIKAIADTIVHHGISLIQNIEKILTWVSSSIAFDKELANKISNGESNTQSALRTLECKKGTCSEYTNLFISIMRSAGIPTRFITGVIAEEGQQMYHAWAECYIEGIGWHGVDPQTAQFWVPSMGIKLFAGKDFIDCNIKTLPEIKAVVKKINE